MHKPWACTGKVPSNSNDSMILWCYDSMFLWAYDSIILIPWFYNYTILWFHGPMILWFHDSMILWFYVSMILWFSDSMVPWSYDSMILQFHVSMIPWFHDPMILWFHARCAVRCPQTQSHDKDYGELSWGYEHGNLLVLLELVHAQEMSIPSKNWMWALCHPDDTHTPPPLWPSHSWGENGTNAPSFAMVGKWVGGVKQNWRLLLPCCPLPSPQIPPRLQF